eukprot:scaffold286397_cov19-Tisochrysis_lutea.AAC.1
MFVLTGLNDGMTPVAAHITGIRSAALVLLVCTRSAAAPPLLLGRLGTKVKALRAAKSVWGPGKLGRERQVTSK